MNFPEFKSSPSIYKILNTICLLLLLYMFYSFFHSMQFSQFSIRSIMQLLLWIAVTIGFYLTRKWAWIIFVVLVSFSVLSIIHAVLSQRMPIHIFPFLSILIGIFILWALNLKKIRHLFNVDKRGQQIVSAHITNFSIFCFVISLFIFVELLGMSQIAASSAPAKLFIGLLGFIHALLGVGIWQRNKTAFQATLSLLIFTAISVTIILVYDYIEASRYLALGRSVFYITICIAMLVYWIKLVQPKIEKDMVEAA